MKYGISIVAVAALMLAAPALADNWLGTAGDGLWKTGANWDSGNPPISGGTAIENGDSVLLDWMTTAATSDLDLNGGSELTIRTDLTVGGDFDFQGAAHVIIESGTVTAGDDLKMDNEASTFKMLGGSFENGVDPGETGYLNMTNALSRLEISGGSFIIEDYVQNMSGTLQVTENLNIIDTALNRFHDTNPETLSRQKSGEGSSKIGFSNTGVCSGYKNRFV